MSDQERVRVLSVLVEDGSNTLSKISGLIRRRGFHVRSISVGPSPQPGRSRMTLTVDAGHAESDQVRKQLERLVEVIEVEDVTGEDVGDFIDELMRHGVVDVARSGPVVLRRTA